MCDVVASVRVSAVILNKKNHRDSANAVAQKHHLHHKNLDRSQISLAIGNATQCYIQIRSTVKLNLTADFNENK